MSGEKSRQGGWIASFIIVGVLLVIGLVGVVYFLKSNEASQIADNAEDAVTETIDGATDESSQDDAQNDSSSNDTEENTRSDASSDSSSSEEDAASSSERPASFDGESDEVSGTDDSDELPQTGPAETVLAMIALSLLTFAGTSYIQSRR